MAFYVGKHLVFLDNFQFMSSSLDKLSNNFPKDEFVYTDMEFKEKASLVKKKGVYPYDYMDSFDQFKRKRLPKKQDFHSILTEKDITEEQYSHAQNVWNTFEIQNMGEYHDLYLNLMSCYLLMFLRISERLVWHITNLIPVIILHLQV